MLLKRIVFTSFVIMMLTLQQSVRAEVLSGCVNKEYIISGSGIVIDQNTNLPVEGAIVSVPAKNIYTVTGGNGEFRLDLPNGKPMILSIKKDGYKPFSLIVDAKDLSRPMKLGILEKTRNEIVINSELHHLGDGKFSHRSANAGDFSSSPKGPYFMQEFYLDDIDTSRDIKLKIGSIIGIDTKIAQSLCQSDVRTSSSSPVKVFLNSRKIGEISVNGDNHTFYVPGNLLRANRYNIVKIETGVNLDSDSDVDYDDIEFMNLFLDIGEF